MYIKFLYIVITLSILLILLSPGLLFTIPGKSGKIIDFKKNNLINNHIRFAHGLLTTICFSGMFLLWDLTHFDKSLKFIFQN